MANLKSLFRDTALYGMSSIVGRFLNYLLVPLYTAKLAASSGGYGVITNVYAYTALLLVLLTFGIFFGAIWANESWGRYWGWDPKETWALVTMIIYALVTHIHLQKFALKEWLFNLLSVLAFSTVLMTFFGVNYFLSGMHSYGQNDHIAHLFTWIALAFGLILLLGFYSGYTIRKYLKTGKGNMPAEDLQ